MILDTFNQSSHYAATIPAGERALTWIQSCPFDRPDGRYEIEGDRGFALVQGSSTTAPTKNNSKPIADTSTSRFYCKERKAFPTPQSPGCRTSTLQLDPGDFALFLPQDGHKPGCLDHTVQAVRKIVIKVQP